MNIPNARDCKHGQLARSCEICELERERDELRAQLLLAALPQVQRDRDELLAENWRLVGQVKALKRERDEAIAHDRQPYPTASAYEAVCAALKAERERRRYWGRILSGRDEPVPTLEGFDVTEVQLELQSRVRALEKVAEAAACVRTVAWDPEGKKYHTHHGDFRETCELCRALEELRGLEG